MAGREVYGVENNDPEMFKGANYIITPTSENTNAKATISGSTLTILGKAATTSAQVFTLSTGTTVTVTVTNITLTIS